MSLSNETTLSDDDRQTLLGLTSEAIHYGINHDAPLTIEPQSYTTALQDSRATFVTLEKQGTLRGCIGSLEAYRALVMDVAMNAYSAAFRDPRFPPVRPDELYQLEMHISVLTPPEEMSVSSEEDLLQQLQPGIDGVILSEGDHRATYLPSVWGQLPEPREFIQNLKVKAGLPMPYWSDSMRVQRYRVESIPTE